MSLRTAFGLDNVDVQTGCGCLKVQALRLTRLVVDLAAQEELSLSVHSDRIADFTVDFQVLGLGGSKANVCKEGRLYWQSLEAAYITHE